ncbi:MAG: exodeoxyribonuclease VII small subunit [Bacteroidales bacterium]|nr:exodeoxyribonuclease VII small subunit [Bacteroidales bacterium]
MKEKFDYAKAVEELEKIERLVQDPSTPLDKIDELLKRAAGLIADCRKYLRTIRESYEEDLRN